MECLSTGSGEDRNPLHSSIPSTSLRGLWDLFPNSHVTQDTILTRQPCQESCLARQHGKTYKKPCKKCIRSQESSLVEGKKKKKKNTLPLHTPPPIPTGRFTPCRPAAAQGAWPCSSAWNRLSQLPGMLPCQPSNTPVSAD